MPFIFILGGANGAGKSTYYEAGIRDGFIDTNLPYLNVDLVAKNEFGSHLPQNLLKAEEFIREWMRVLISSKQNFIIESNLAKSSEYEWLEKLISHGYQLKMDFLSTGDVEINKLRVHHRVSEGGHDVPDNIIEQRSAMGITYLKSKVFIFEE